MIGLLMKDKTDHLIGLLVSLFLLSLMKISVSISVSSRYSYKWSLLYPIVLEHCTTYLFPMSLPDCTKRDSAGLRNLASCDPVRERGDHLFGERPYATIGLLFIVAANGDIPNDEFPNDDFFPDGNDLFSDMTIGTSAPSATEPYAILSSLLGLAFGLL